MPENCFWKVTFTRNGVEDFRIIWKPSQEDAEEEVVAQLVKEGIATNCLITEVRLWGAA